VDEAWGSLVEHPQVPSFTHLLSCWAPVSIQLSSPEEATQSNTSDTDRDWAPQCYSSPSIVNQVDVNFLSI